MQESNKKPEKVDPMFWWLMAYTVFILGLAAVLTKYGFPR